MIRKLSSAKSFIFKTKTPSEEVIKKDEQELSPIEKVADIIIDQQLNLLIKIDKLTIQDKLTDILVTVVSRSRKDENKKTVSGFELVKDALQQLRQEGTVKSIFNEEYLYEIVIKRLIIRGAQVNKANAIKRTPLHFAAENIDHGDVAARILIDNKAHLKARDVSELTPLDLASFIPYCKKSKEVIYNAEKKLPASIRSLSFGPGSPHLHRYKRGKNPDSFNSDNAAITNTVSTPAISESVKLEANRSIEEKLPKSVKFEEAQGAFQNHHAKNVSQQSVGKEKIKTLINHFEGLKN